MVPWVQAWLEGVEAGLEAGEFEVEDSSKVEDRGPTGGRGS